MIHGPIVLASLSVQKLEEYAIEKITLHALSQFQQLLAVTSDVSGNTTG